jgi:hypothetical protein
MDLETAAPGVLTEFRKLQLRILIGGRHACVDGNSAVFWYCHGMILGSRAGGDDHAHVRYFGVVNAPGVADDQANGSDVLDAAVDEGRQIAGIRFARIAHEITNPYRRVCRWDWSRQHEPYYNRIQRASRPSRFR